MRTAVMVTLLIDWILVTPAALFVAQVMVPALLWREVLGLHITVRTRMRLLLRRTRGQLRTLYSLTQFFNPACTAARSMPFLPVSRMLLSLGDFELR